MNLYKVDLALSIIVALILSCHKDNPNPLRSECVINESISSTDTSFYIYESGKEKYGFATAIKLNKPWRASASAQFDQGQLKIIFETFIVSSKDPYSERKSEYFPLVLVEQKEGCYEVTNEALNSKAKASFFAVDEDVTHNVYNVMDSSQINKFQLDTFNVKTGRVAGKFMISFIRDNFFGGPKYDPEFVRFFNGEFHCRIN